MVDHSAAEDHSAGADHSAEARCAQVDLHAQAQVALPDAVVAPNAPVDLGVVPQARVAVQNPRRDLALMDVRGSRSAPVVRGVPVERDALPENVPRLEGF